MGITINDVSARADYVATSGQTVFTLSFVCFDASDLKVYKNATLLTLSTNYTVQNAGSNSGLQVTLTTGASAGDAIAIVREVPYSRTTELPTTGPFQIGALNTFLSKVVAMIQQLRDKGAKAIQIPTSDTGSVSTVLPVAANRLGKVLAFNATTGSPEMGPTVASVESVAANAANVQTVASNITNVNTVASNISNVNSVGTNIASVNTAAANISSINNAASNASAAATSATNAANSATAAATSATNAANSATAATTNGAAQVTLAAAQVTLATTQATNAATSASSASSSASAASSSASAASTSATNAASSATAASASAASAAASSASGLYRQVLDKTTNYTIVAADQGTLFRANTGSGAITFTLPSISSTSDGFKISIVKWTSDANVVNVNRSGSDTINGATTSQIGSQYSQVIFVADFETNTWFASQSGLGATNMNVDVFSGNGSTTAFTLAADPGSKNNTNIFIGGVHQDHATYSVSGTTLTFSTAPPTGTSNIEVNYGTPLPIGSPSDGTVTPAKLSSGRPYWDNSGMIGIGTDTPSSAKVVVSGNSIGNSNIRLINTASGGRIWDICPFAVGVADTIFAIRDGTAAADRLSIDSSGNVGIGASSPASRLNVATASSGTPLTITMSSNTSGSGAGDRCRIDCYSATNAGAAYQLGFIDFDRSDGTGTASQLTFNTRVSGTVAERARIDSSSNFLVGTTTAAGRIALGYAGLTSVGIGFIDSSATGTTQATTFNKNGTQVGSIQTSNSATSYVTSSDYRLKNSIAPMVSGLATVSALKPVTYKWNADNSDGEGFIAHELQAVIPFAVTGEKDAVDEEGNIKPQGVDYSKIVVHLVAAMQEQQTQISELKARVAALEAK